MFFQCVHINFNIFYIIVCVMCNRLRLTCIANMFLTWVRPVLLLVDDEHDEDGNEDEDEDGDDDENDDDDEDEDEE